MDSFDLLPRVDICHTPTPIESAPNLSKELGCNIFIKRDDCTGLASGGNKARKLEYLIADAKQQGADTLITVGGLQSNHARQTAAAAAKFGFKCELILQEVDGFSQDNYSHNGNVLLNHLFNATIHKLTSAEDPDAYANQLTDQIKQRGERPYFIPIGGSNVIGSLGYVRCAKEILQQLKTQALDIDLIILATGSAGTQAGLITGLITEHSQIPVLGINVSRSELEQNELVNLLLINMLSKLKLDHKLANNRVVTNGDFYGESYGAITASMVNAVKQCASLEGLLLDPVYSGKAMAGLIGLCKQKIIEPQSNILFLHTGGSASLFAYQEAFNK